MPPWGEMRITSVCGVLCAVGGSHGGCGGDEERRDVPQGVGEEQGCPGGGGVLRRSKGEEGGEDGRGARRRGERKGEACGVRDGHRGHRQLPHVDVEGREVEGQDPEEVEAHEGGHDADRCTHGRARASIRSTTGRRKLAYGL